jgi:hypothetical protein
LCYLAVWSGDDWRQEVRRALEDGRRVLRPGGMMILLETLCTGYETPYRPPKLAAYYTLLEEQGFCSMWIRTDFRFESVEEARELLGFFFGEDAAKEMIREGSVTVPECTGIWWLKNS